MKEFLLQTSILEKLSGPLCDALIFRAEGTAVERVPASQDILENLERSNYFVVPLDDFQAWFRYHHLFRDLLQARLEKSRPGLVSELHHRAAQWYEQNEMVEDAIQHTRAISDYEHTAELLEKCIERMLTEGAISSVMQWCVELPEEVLARHPWLCVEFLRGAFLIGTLDQYPHIYQNVELYLQAHAGASQPLDRKMRANFNVVKANRAFMDQDLQGTIQYGNLAIQQMDKDSQVRQGVMVLIAYAWILSGEMDKSDLVWQEILSSLQQNSNVYAQILSLCSFSRSFFLYMRGNLHESYDQCQRTIDTLKQRGKHNLPGAALVDLGKSFTLEEWGKYEEAAQLCEWTLENLELLGMPDFILLALQCLAVAQRRLGKFEQANATLKRGWEIVQHASIDPMKLIGFHHEQVLLWLALGEIDQADQFVQQAGLNPDASVTLVHVRDFLSQAHTWIARARKGERQWYGRVEEALKQHLEIAERSGWNPSQVAILALLAAVQKEQAREEEAVATIEQALVLAEPENYVHLFLEAGKPVDDLLRNMTAYPVSPEYIHRILAGFQGETQAYISTA